MSELFLEAGTVTTPTRFRCVVADPPWDVKRLDTVRASEFSRRSQVTQSVPLPYKTMTVEQICALSLPVENEAHCYIWTINRYVEDAYKVARAWGFTPSTLLFWLKQPMGIGHGGAFSLCVEPILFARRGSLKVKRRCDRNWWAWEREGHSRKPEAFQTLIESISPGPYLELFARRRRQGWFSFGDEVQSDITL